MELLNKLKESKKYTACITGHRPKTLPWKYDETKESCKNFKTRIKQIFVEKIEEGVEIFMTGMAEGFDMISTEILIDLRQSYRDIKIIAVIPCKDQEKRWNAQQQSRYLRIISECDDVIILAEKYTDTCMNERNLFMVQHSNYCIACWNGKPSGTGNTVRFANENHCNVTIMNPNDFITRN